MSVRVEIIGEATLMLGDCRELLDVVGPVDAVVSDPPYGMKWDGRITRGKNGTGKFGPTRHFGQTIAGDAEPFDPAPWAAFPLAILWGCNHFGSRLPVGSTLVWIKRHDSGFGSFLSDAEVAWMKGGHGVYCFRDLSLQGESSDRAHPTQKPVGLMTWCIEQLKGEPQSIFDPFMGSGTTGVACAKLGRRFIGCEIDPLHFNTACRRIEEAYRQPRLFADTPPKPKQPSFFDGEAA